MGNSVSRAKFMCMDSDVDWESYVSQDWRSERSRELDQLGGKVVRAHAKCVCTLAIWDLLERVCSTHATGLDRPAIARGDSMTAKLGFLGSSLRRQGREMEDALGRGKGKEKPKEQKYLLQTDLRCAGLHAYRLYV